MGLLFGALDGCLGLSKGVCLTDFLVAFLYEAVACSVNLDCYSLLKYIISQFGKKKNRK